MLNLFVISFKNKISNYSNLKLETINLKYEFPTHEYIKDVKCPVIIFHGKKDKVVNYENSVKLNEILPKEQVNFVTVPMGGHNLENTPIYKREMIKLLK
ncbi:alpha/beta fold hydrolase [Aequorivita echinoideorum]|uniref:Alpha/beta fold hydrolase n=1 Tax=Aequorivita echinoideorum TaxID=1549647 RepID=A0ABS5S5S5_9FLAO|nr:alpha/beta fold hydrolase [Aequorivita echinoideorum]MBT0608571.1 alpha/beta fold hydrolase [Aequorivita echinoideorum]